MTLLLMLFFEYRTLSCRSTTNIEFHFVYYHFYIYNKHH